MELTFGHKKEGAPNKKAEGGLFAQKKKDTPDHSVDLATVQEQSMTATRMLRVLEEHQTNMRRKIQMVEQNILSHNRRLDDEMKTINSDIMEVRRLISSVESKIMLIIKELKETARKDDIDVVKKYVDMWEPVNFVTREEVELIIKEVLEGK